ncbi:MAG: hypothetical protein BWY11_00595 [Firmicutes bacterium ADurb.Bin182]|nr:MAG: hypothetical protein BWY11_00595 [Firmicutes bacterium ADurb.Bin182]
MQFAVALLICVIILSMTDVLEGPLRFLSVNKWVLSAACAILIAANAFPVRLFAEFILNPAALIAVIMLASLSAFSGFLITLAGVLCAILSGIIISFIDRSSMDIIKGLWIFIVVIFPLVSFSRLPYIVMLCGALIPLFTDIADAAHELATCGYTIVQLGTSLSFDALVTIVILSAGISYTAHLIDTRQRRIE